MNVAPTPEGDSMALSTGIMAHVHTMSCAINAEFATMDTPVGAGDEIAFLPPVSGGAATHP